MSFDRRAFFYPAEKIFSNDIHVFLRKYPRLRWWLERLSLSFWVDPHVWNIFYLHFPIFSIVFHIIQRTRRVSSFNLLIACLRKLWFLDSHHEWPWQPANIDYSWHPELGTPYVASADPPIFCIGRQGSHVPKMCAQMFVRRLLWPVLTANRSLLRKAMNNFFSVFAP